MPRDLVEPRSCKSGRVRPAPSSSDSCWRSSFISIRAGFRHLHPARPKPRRNRGIRAPAVRRIEREQAWVQFLERLPATWAAHLRAQHRGVALAGIEDPRGLCRPQGAFDQFLHRFREPAHRWRTSIVCSRKRSSLSKFPQRQTSRPRAASRIPALGPFGHFAVKAFSRLHQWREDVNFPGPAAVSACFVIAAALCFSTGRSHFGQNCVPSFANRRRRK